MRVRRSAASDTRARKIAQLRLNTRIDELTARFEAQTEMFNARFMGLEHAMLEMSARTFFGTKQYESTTSRYERELGELRARVARLEERVEPTKPL